MSHFLDDELSPNFDPDRKFCSPQCMNNHHNDCPQFRKVYQDNDNRQEIVHFPDGTEALHNPVIICQCDCHYTEDKIENPGPQKGFDDN